MVQPPAPPAPLAQLADAEAIIGRELENDEAARLTQLLRFASARVRAYVGMQISQGPVLEHCKVRPGGIVRLSQLPVVEVTQVTDPNNGTVLLFSPYGPAGILVGVAGGSAINYPGDVDAYGGSGWFPWWLPRYVDVAYTAGMNPVPDIVVAITVQAAVRALYNTMPVPPNATGAATQQPPGGVWLMSDEKASLDQAFPRVPVGPIDMYGPTAPRPSL